jgi:myo-inositol-1(or 4)-monophosphatase
MSPLQLEKEFFHAIAPRIIELVQSYGENVSIAKQKDFQSDFSTEIDIAVENLIIQELKQAFPDDQIIAEESTPDKVLRSGRIWIIDPICGTSNLSRGIKNYCTNIALSNSKQLIAACVVDHSQAKYVWSIGDNEVYINNHKIDPIINDQSVNIDIDLGGLPKSSNDIKKRHIVATQKLLLNTDYKLLSLNTSLSVLYVAIGKIDGIIFPAPYLWDIAAGSFLIQQSGGFITDLKGSPWHIGSVGAIAAVNSSIHKLLIECYN